VSVTFRGTKCGFAKELAAASEVPPFGKLSGDTYVFENEQNSSGDKARAQKNEGGTDASAAFQSELISATDPKNNASNKPEQVKVLTFNIALDGQFGLQGVIDLIKKTDADVVGLQEAGDNTKKIADALGYNYVLHGDAAVLTRLDIDGTSDGGNGVLMHTKSGKKFAFFDEHLYYKPYQPYQLLHIPYEDSKFINTEAEAIDEATKARGANLQEARNDIASLKDEKLPTIVVGDFNEPSHLDWTAAAAKSGRHPVKVEWPTTKAFERDGFHDSYREIYPDEMAHPGYTWTPTTKDNDPKDHHDRIDYVLYRGDGIKVNSVQIIGEDAQHADIPITPFPSDHRAITATFELSDNSRK
jgi:exodeoxyribonuclease-3